MEDQESSSSGVSRQSGLGLWAGKYVIMWYMEVGLVCVQQARLERSAIQKEQKRVYVVDVISWVYFYLIWFGNIIDHRGDAMVSNNILERTVS